MIKKEANVSKKFLIVILGIIIVPYTLAWAVYGLSSAVAHMELHHRYGKFIQAYACGSSDLYLKSAPEPIDLNSIKLNYDPVYAWLQPFYVYKGFVYYLNYPDNSPGNPTHIGATSGTVTAWGHIKEDDKGYYGCGL